MSQMKKAIVTGSGGCIGKPLVTRLRELGIPVICVNRSEVPSQQDGVFYARDVALPDAITPFCDSETTIFHLAANAKVPYSVKNPMYDFSHTLASTLYVLESARKTGAKVIFPSSPSVFASDNPLPLLERSVVRPSSPYGAAKAGGEAYCFAYYQSYGVDVRISRIFNIYGKGVNRFIIYDLIQKLLQNPEYLEILGTGDQIRDYLYIDDVIEALITIATHGKAGEDYNIASGVGTNITQLALDIATIIGRPDIEIRPTGQSWAGDIPAWFGNIEKMNALGFRPSIQMSEGLARTVDWVYSTTPACL
jgi:UDP-glucose 4-epimerase